MVLYGLKVDYVMWVCLGIVMVWDIIRLRAPAIFIELPLLIALFYHALHGTLKLSGVALIFPFIFHFIGLVRGRIAFYDLLAMGMVGVVMGWPFGALTVLLAKAFFWFLGIIRIVNWKLGTRIYIDKSGDCTVADRMAERFQNRIDIFMDKDAARAKKFGIQKLLTNILN